MRGAAVEQFLRRRRIGQRETEFARRGERQIEVFLVQFDAEAGVEGALDHALTVHFENLGGRKAAHQRFTHLGGIGTGLGGEEQGFADGFDVECDDDLVGDRCHQRE